MKKANSLLVAMIFLFASTAMAKPKPPKPVSRVAKKVEVVKGALKGAAAVTVNGAHAASMATTSLRVKFMEKVSEVVNSCKSDCALVNTIGRIASTEGRSQGLKKDGEAYGNVKKGIQRTYESLVLGLFGNNSGPIMRDIFVKMGLIPDNIIKRCGK